MQIKMSEYFQEVGLSVKLIRTDSMVNSMEPGEVYECSGNLAQYLLDNRKGVEFGGKVEKVKSEAVKEEPVIQENVTNVEKEEIPLMTTANQAKRGRK